MKIRMMSVLIWIVGMGLASCSPMLESLPPPSSPSPMVSEAAPTSSPTKEIVMTLPPETVSTGTPAVHGNAYIESCRITAGSKKDSIFVYITGNLPTPCHQVQVKVNPPNEENRLYLEVYSSAKNEGMCVQVLTPFEHKAEVSNLADGEYSLYINGRHEADFRIPIEDA